MTDPVNIAKERLAKAEARLLRLEKQVETARSDVADLRTTVRVMAEITGETLTDSTPVEAQGRPRHIVMLLPEGEENGAGPSEIFENYRRLGADDVSPDTFRATLWRMKNGIYFMRDRGSWVIRSSDGRYWKESITHKDEAPDAETSGASETTGPVTGRERGYPPSTPEGSIPSGSTHVQPASFDTDLDDDVPF